MKTEDSLAVLIATKNRKNELYNLLNSISQSSVLPSRIIIVYAGQSLENILIDLNNKMKIDLFFSEISSQT